MNLGTKQKPTHRFREWTYGYQGEGEGRDSSGVWDGHVHTAKLKVDNHPGPTVEHGEHCRVLACMGGGFGGEWIHVHVWLSPLAVHLQLSQLC